MKEFLQRIIGFLILLGLFFVTALLLPTTPRAAKSLLAADIQKDSLMKYTNPPRIIFIGGSNLSFGLNSQMIEDSLGLNPVNTGIHAAIGLVYMMDNAIQFIKEGDIIILIPEYDFFFGTIAYGSEELLRTILDINPAKFTLLNLRQICNIVPYVPKYALTKFKPREYVNIKVDKLYGVNSFNKFGDVYTHWEMRREFYKPAEALQGKFKQSVIREVLKFRSEVEEKGGIFFISYPGTQDQTYENRIEQIKKVENAYKANSLQILGSPERYMIPDSMTFNTPVHLTKEGVDYRTMLLIEDLKIHANESKHNR